MAYCDYGGYVYKNNVRQPDHSDCEILDTGDLWHAVLGDGNIRIALFKQSCLAVFRGGKEVPHAELAKDQPEMLRSWESDGETLTCIYYQWGKSLKTAIDGYQIEVWWWEENNYYILARLTEPDGTVWIGWSGYHVGAGFEGEQREDVNAMAQDIWPDFQPREEAEDDEQI